VWCGPYYPGEFPVAANGRKSLMFPGGSVKARWLRVIIVRGIASARVAVIARLLTLDPPESQRSYSSVSGGGAPGGARCIIWSRRMT
jgi:hypothetical protein